MKSGDTLSEIAKANGVSVADILKANPDIDNPDVIKAGQKIIIPHFKTVAPETVKKEEPEVKKAPAPEEKSWWEKATSWFTGSDEKPKAPNKDNSKRDDFETFEEMESREDAAEIEELEALREMIAEWDYEDSVKLAKARISGEKASSGNGFLNLLVPNAEASDGSTLKEEEGWISKESKKYFSKKLVEYLAKTEAEKHGLELIMAIIGYDLHMVGAGISEVEKEFPKLGKAVDKITEILNKPFDLLGEKISSGYSAAKEGLISEIGERYGSAKADEVRDYIAFKERAVGQELYKFAPDEKQERTLKYMEVIGVGKLLKEMSLFGVKKLVYHEVSEVIDFDKLMHSASITYKGTTKLGHALSKHAGRKPEIWGKIQGRTDTWHFQAQKHFNDIMQAPGNFIRVEDPITKLKWLEKRLPDGRGMRLNIDKTFKGFID